MLKIKISKASLKFLKKLPAKHQKQIALKIQELREKGQSHDSKKLCGHLYLRADVGEYRIIYEIEADIILLIILVGKRNDGEVYKKLERLQG